MGQQTWLIAHDFSPPAEAAADLALDEALRSRGAIRLVLGHMFTVTIPTASEAVLPTSASIPVELATQNEVNELLDKVGARLEARLAKAPPRPPDERIEIALTARRDAPAEGILAEAARVGASRIVMGTHGRRGLGHWLLGSVAERVVRMSPIPVLVTRANEATGESP